MLISGKVVSMITFPGVIIHEISHRFFCDLAKIPVYEVRYFNLDAGKFAGYVSHGKVNDLKSSFLISIGPLIINSLLCMLLTMPLMFPMSILKTETINPALLLLAWVGFSIGMHAFPSNEDMDGFRYAVKESKGVGILYLISAPFAWIIKIANALRVVWFDFIYAVLISFIIPTLLLR